MKVTDEMVYRALAWFYPCEDWPPESEPTAADEIAFRRDRMEVMRGTLEAALRAPDTVAFDLATALAELLTMINGWESTDLWCVDARTALEKAGWKR